MAALAEDLRRLGIGGRATRAAGEGRWTDRELIRLGRRMSLDLRRTLALVLKAQWEVFERPVETGERGSNPVGPHGRGVWASRSSTPGTRFHAGLGQSADAAGLFVLFEEEGHYATAWGYDRDTFETLVHQCILLALHRVPNDGPEMEAFVAAEEAQRALLSVATPDAREAYWLKHAQWREAEAELDDLLLEVETQALENERVQQRWLEMFGALYLSLEEARLRCESLERRLRRKKEEPGLSLADLDRLDQECRRAEEREISRLRGRLARINLSDGAGGGGMPMEASALEGYEEECRRLLREIYRRTHPDVVGQHGFTTDQKDFLTACYREAVAWGRDSGVGEEEIALGMRSLEALEAILARARSVWQSMGLAWNEQGVIQGETVAQRIAWFEDRIASLEREARGLKADLFVLATDEDVQEKQASMMSPAVVARVRDQMQARTTGFNDRALQWERTLSELFQQVGAAPRDPGR